MLARLPRKLVLAILLAVPVALALTVFVETCGAVHGSPRCGTLSYAAIPVVVGALALEGLAFRSPQSEFTVRVLIWAVTYAVAFVLCFLAVHLSSRLRR